MKHNRKQDKQVDEYFFTCSKCERKVRDYDCVYHVVSITYSEKLDGFQEFSNVHCPHCDNLIILLMTGFGCNPEGTAAEFYEDDENEASE